MVLFAFGGKPPYNQRTINLYEITKMSKTDEEMIVKIVLGLCGLAIVIFVFWLVFSAIQFLSEHLFIYGLIIGLVAGGFITFSTIVWIIPWWNDKFIPWWYNEFIPWLRSFKK